MVMSLVLKQWAVINIPDKFIHKDLKKAELMIDCYFYDILFLRVGSRSRNYKYCRPLSSVNDFTSCTALFRITYFYRKAAILCYGLKGSNGNQVQS